MTMTGTSPSTRADGDQSVDKGSCGGSCDGVKKVEKVHPENKGAGHETLSHHRERAHRL